MAYNTQDFGPWNRFEELNQPQQSPRQSLSVAIKHKSFHSKSLPIRQQIEKQKANPILPQVQKKQQQLFPSSPIKQQIIKSIANKPQKNRQLKIKNAIKINQVQIKLIDKQLKSYHQFQPPTRKFNTISIGSIFNNSNRKIDKNNKKNQKNQKNQKPLSNSFHFHPKVQQKINQLKQLKKVSMVEIGAQLANQNPQHLKLFSHHLERRNNQYFSRKRSLLEMIKIIKNSGQDNFFTQREGSHKKRHSSLSKYAGKPKPFDVINISLQSEEKYTPSFLAIKSNSITKRL